MQAETLTRIISPLTEINFAFELAEVTLPLQHERDNIGTIVDATGRGLIVVDLHREMPDAQVADIAELIVLAVNAYGGFSPSADPRGAA